MIVVVYVDGKVIENEDIGPKYRGGRRIAFPIERGISFDAFKELIIEEGSISRMEMTVMFKLPTISYPNPTYKFVLIELVDDNGIGLIFDTASSIPGYILEIFINQRLMNRFGDNTTTDVVDDDYLQQHEHVNSIDHEFFNSGADDPCIQNDDEYESSLEDVDLHLGEDGHDVDVANELNGMRIFEPSSTIMSKDTWTNVVDPIPPIVSRSNLGWDGISELFEGQVFMSKDEVQRATEKYSMDRNLMYQVDQSTKRLLVLKCNNNLGETCRWRLRATRKEGDEEWIITKYSGPHSCVVVSSTPDHRQLTARYIASRIVNVVSKDPSLKIKVLQAMVNELTGGYNPSYDKTWLGKQIAIATIFGDWDKSYEKLPMYLAALQKYNPGTEVHLNTVPSVIPGTVIFDQVFWAFAPAIEGFRWSFAHDGGRRYGTLTTNVSKSFNGVLKDARHLPITATIMTTFFKSVEYFTDKASKAASKMEVGQIYSNFAIDNDYWKLQSNVDMYTTLAFQPVHDERYWPEYCGDKVVPDKDRLRGKGRPRVNRIRNEMDEFLESQPSQK
ncbi:hypothetical protein Vadar_030456 [Vaccinium darrowii]|uniref:Uncharacterized protein n=1 Tax=Vaccinium darrowii TaxID=229202 RepID=A0ACB7XV81_9ERIC|nr:hypothetical protein Vadar_030456 [Vaccinium darrowii]